MCHAEMNLPLRDAVCLALARGGIDLLNRPKTFVSYIMDYADPDSLELRVLIYNCDEDLLAPYAARAGGGVEGLRTAANIARADLEFERKIYPPIAESVANGIAEGIAAWGGVAWDTSVGDNTPADSEQRQKRPLRRGRIPGIYIDSRERAHISTLLFDDDSMQPTRFDVEVVELRSLKHRLAQLLGQAPNMGIDVLASASDLSFSRSLRLRKLLEDSGINVLRWRVPSDALSVGHHYFVRANEDAHILAVHLGVTSCTIGLYEFADGVCECLAIARNDVSEDLYQRQTVIASLLKTIDQDSGGCLVSRPAGCSRLWVYLVDELGHAEDIARAVRLSLSSMADDTWDIETASSDCDEMARGLAVRGGVFSGDIEGIMALDATWFDILLEGDNGCELVIMHGTTIPTFKSEVIDCFPEDSTVGIPVGNPTAVIVSDTQGKGVKLPLPPEARVFANKTARALNVSIEVDADSRCKIRLQNSQTNRSTEYCLDDLLEQATSVSVTKKMKEGPVSNGGAESAYSAPQGNTTAQATGQASASSTEAAADSQKSKKPVEIDWKVIAFGFAVLIIVAVIVGSNMQTSTTGSNASAVTSDGSTKSQSTKDPWGPLNRYPYPPKEFKNPHKGEFGTWDNGTYESEKLGIKIVMNEEVVPARIDGVVEDEGRTKLNFDMGSDWHGNKRLNKAYECVYVLYDGDDSSESAVFGIDGFDAPKLPEGVTVEEALDGDRDYEKVEFRGKTWWRNKQHGKQQSEPDSSGTTVTFSDPAPEADNYYETYITPVGDRMARLQVTADDDESAASNVKKLLSTVEQL